MRRTTWRAARSPSLDLLPQPGHLGADPVENPEDVRTTALPVRALPASGIVVPRLPPLAGPPGLAATVAHTGRGWWGYGGGLGGCSSVGDAFTAP